MTTFTHLINPFLASSGSEHDRAQRVTFAALRAAVEDAQKRDLAVEVLAVCFPQDVVAVEPPAKALPVLTRTVQDIARLEPPRDFPIVMDLLRAAQQHGTGSHLVFTNMDICPQPYFYDVLAQTLDRGVSAMSVSRRTVPDHYTGPEQLPAMTAHPGQVHWGHDTFVFPRSWVEKFDMEEICYGSAAFDKALGANMDAISGYRARHYQYQHLTFHLGDDRAWAARSQYTQFNVQRCAAVMERLRTRFGPPPRRSLFKNLEDRLLSRPVQATAPTLIDRLRRKWHHLTGSGPEMRMWQRVREARAQRGLELRGFGLG